MHIKLYYCRKFSILSVETLKQVHPSSAAFLSFAAA